VVEILLVPERAWGRLSGKSVENLEWDATLSKLLLMAELDEWAGQHQIADILVGNIQSPPDSEFDWQASSCL
jgi:hypothetical protein